MVVSIIGGPVLKSGVVVPIVVVSVDRLVVVDWVVALVNLVPGLYVNSSGARTLVGGASAIKNEHHL